MEIYVDKSFQIKQSVCREADFRYAESLFSSLVMLFLQKYNKIESAFKQSFR